MPALAEALSFKGNDFPQLECVFMYGAFVLLFLSMASFSIAAAQQATGQYSGQYKGEYSGRVDGRGNKSEGISPEAGDALRESQKAKAGAENKANDAEAVERATRPFTADH